MNPTTTSTITESSEFILRRLQETFPDWALGVPILFALAVLIVSGLGMGVLPALRLSDTDLKTVLNEHGRRTTSSAATSRVMSGMIVAEVALAIALVAGAGWLVQSFARLRTIDEAAELLNVSPRTVRRLIESGALPVHRPLGRLVRIADADLAALLAASRRVEW